MAELPKKRNRVDSRAHTRCPHCGKKVHGQKGLKQHTKEVHDAPAR